MMIEAKKYFLEKLGGCYQVRHKDFPYSIFWYYKKDIIRQKKLNRVINGDIVVDCNFGGELIFDMNTRDNLFWIKARLWVKIENLLGVPDYGNTQLFTINVLRDYLRNNEYKTTYFCRNIEKQLERLG